MVVGPVYDFMDTAVYMAITGLVLAVAGIQGVVSPDSWALATGMVGQVFNVLPNVVHQGLGALVAFSGVSQVWDSVQKYV